MAYQIVLNDALKTFTADQDKIFPPEETVRRFKEKLKHADLDILEYTLRIDTGRLGIPVYFSSCGKDAASVIGTKKQMGKGGTPQQAEASAVMELAERFSFFSFSKNPENFILETRRNLKDKAIPFDMIARSVHDDSQNLEAAQKIFDNLRLKWTRAYNLTRNEEILIPFDWFFTINEFNGPSAGNCTEESLSQGISEIVERHVCSLISQNQLKIPLIRPDSATDPLVREMIEKYRNTGIKFWLSDFSLNMGIPTVAMLAYDPATFPEKSEIVWTAGTTPDPQKALSRALTETAQLAGDFNTGSNYVASGLPKPARIENMKFITDPGKQVDISELPNLSHPNIKTEVQNLIASLSKKGMEVITVNITHPLLEIPAFYTIVPGAHFRERAMGTSVGMFSAKLIAENNPPDGAIPGLKQMAAMLPGKYYIQFYLGSSYLSAGDPETALKYYQQAAALNPTEQDLPSIYSYMGVCLKDMGQYREALDVLKIGEKSDSERTDIYNLMGFCHFKLKEHEKAIECFQNVIRLNPASAIDYANIASNYRDMGQKEKAIEYYMTALAIDPSIDFARENLEKLGNSQ
jgi:ribosomal protein S12 methylthiotransferase accessory factor